MGWLVAKFLSGPQVQNFLDSSQQPACAEQFQPRTRELVEVKTKPRNSPIDLIVLHDPEGANTAQELYNFLQHIDAGYHSLDDDQEEIICAADNQVVQGAGGVNSRALHICFVPGRTAWTREQWLTHTAAIKRGAERAATWSKLHDIPLVWLTPAQVATPGVKGLCTHGDVTAAGYTASEGHTDPGPNFPRDVFLTFAQGNVIVPAKEIEDMLIQAPPNQQKDPNAPACVSLDMVNKKVNALNGAHFDQPGQIVTGVEIRGWYELFYADGITKRGFVVVGARDPASGKNPAFTFTW